MSLKLLQGHFVALKERSTDSSCFCGIRHKLNANSAFRLVPERSNLIEWNQKENIGRDWIFVGGTESIVGITDEQQLIV